MTNNLSTYSNLRTAIIIMLNLYVIWQNEILHNLLLGNRVGGITTMINSKNPGELRV